MILSPLLKNSFAIFAGLFLGSVVNMGIITLSTSIIPLPLGSDNTTMDGMIASMHLYKPKHYIFPFLAHALGTFTGAFLASLVAKSHQLKLALFIGFFFFAGGTYMILSLPSPVWFSVLDLVGAYIPMAYFGWKLALATKMVRRQNETLD